MTDDDFAELVERDPTAALFYLVKSVGGTITLHGAPVTPTELRHAALESARDRLVDAIMSEGSTTVELDADAARLHGDPGQGVVAGSGDQAKTLARAAPVRAVPGAEAGDGDDGTGT